jgi:hypothetical protein
LWPSGDTVGCSMYVLEAVLRETDRTQLSVSGRWSASVSNASDAWRDVFIFPLLLALGAYWGLLAVPGVVAANY